LTLRDLNRNQRRAVERNDGPLLVLGGPGSGKTAVLTLRIVRLLEEDDDAAVLGLACTDKAAAEMRERVNGILGEHTDRARFRTFHEFAADILGQHGSHLGIRPDFRLTTQDEDRVAILEEVIAGLPGGGGRLPADRNNLLQLIDRLFSESYRGDGPSSSLTTTPPWLPSLFRRYCDALVAANRLDFGSLLHFANRLLREKPAVARVVRLGWTHICVDEFQDTNRAQYDMLRLIAPGRRHNLFVVADDDQIIYQWNGASPRRFDDLRNDYELDTVQLPESYRCPPEIVDSFLDGGWRSWSVWTSRPRRRPRRRTRSRASPCTARRDYVRACLTDRDGPGSVSILSGAQGRAAEQGSAGGAPELLRGDHAGAGDADVDAGAAVLRVCEGGVAVSGGDGGVRGGGRM